MRYLGAIIYLIGKPGVGKFSIAKEISKKSNYIVCDNQLINNPVFKLLKYDGYGEISEIAAESISKIRVIILELLIKFPKITIS